MQQFCFRMIVDQKCLAMMGYSNCDAQKAGKDNKALKEYRCHGFRIVSVCRWHIM